MNQITGSYFITSKKQGAQTLEANIKAATAAAKQASEFFLHENVEYQVN